MDDLGKALNEALHGHPTIPAPAVVT
jgi:hypothetical protein